jgi:glycerophosphoryl diester phosphodiesterase
MGGLHYLLYLVVQRSSTSISLLVVATGVVLVTETAVAILLSVLVDISLVGVVLALYRQSAPFEVLSGHEAPQPATVNETAKASPRVGSLGWKLGAFLATGVALTVAAGALWVRGLKLHDGFEITAHRAGATAAPENTVAAIRQAILDQADWAEIDVQLTADQALVVMHDIDLARVGGGNRRVDQATLAEIQSLDVGAAFGPQFAGEQIPTLAEILAAAGDRIRLNVELKPHSRQNARDLTRRVVAEIQEKGMTHRCRICSQSYESLQLARQIEPSFEVGFIVATAVGDLTRLDVNFLMVERKLASRRLVDRARVSGLDVHAWTVNDPSQVASLLDAGIANLITDDPAVMRARLEEIRGLDTLERLLLRASHALAR